jgi:hypothetical protein
LKLHSKNMPLACQSGRQAGKSLYFVVRAKPQLLLFFLHASQCMEINATPTLEFINPGYVLKSRNSEQTDLYDFGGVRRREIGEENFSAFQIQQFRGISGWDPTTVGPGLREKMRTRNENEPVLRIDESFAMVIHGPRVLCKIGLGRAVRVEPSERCLCLLSPNAPHFLRRSAFKVLVVPYDMSARRLGTAASHRKAIFPITAGRAPSVLWAGARHTQTILWSGYLDAFAACPGCLHTCCRPHAGTKVGGGSPIRELDVHGRCSYPEDDVVRAIALLLQPDAWSARQGALPSPASSPPRQGRFRSTPCPPPRSARTAGFQSAASSPPTCLELRPRVLIPIPAAPLPRAQPDRPATLLRVHRPRARPPPGPSHPTPPRQARRAP